MLMRKVATLAHTHKYYTTVNATYSWVESEARRVLREVLNVREKERRQEVTPPVACARRARVEVSDDDDDDDDNRVGVGAAA